MELLETLVNARFDLPAKDDFGFEFLVGHCLKELPPAPDFLKFGITHDHVPEFPKRQPQKILGAGMRGFAH